MAAAGGLHRYPAHVRFHGNHDTRTLTAANELFCNDHLKEYEGRWGHFEERANIPPEARAFVFAAMDNEGVVSEQLKQDRLILQHDDFAGWLAEWDAETWGDP